MQGTQLVFVAEECVKSAYNKFEAESNFRREVEKTLRSIKEEKSQLAEKLKTFEHNRQSALTGLKTTEAQAKVQRKRLFTTELNLATKKAAVLSLKVELEKAKAEAQAIQEATQATERVAYERGILETEQRLAEEVAEVCRDYCYMTWDVALKNAGVSTNSELRRVDRVFFPEHIREIPTDLSSAALPLPSLEQVPSAQDLPIDIGTSTRVGTGKEGLPPASDAPSEDALTIRDVTSQAKVVEKPKDGDLAKTATTKEDPHLKKR